MSKLKIVLDINVVVDFLNMREPYYEDARKLMICGRVGEFDLCITASQFTDLVYILSNGGNKKRLTKALESLRGLRSFITILPVTVEEIDPMLDSTWEDPEDHLIYYVAIHNGADALVTRNEKDFVADIIPVLNCTAFFDWLKAEFGLVYEEVEFQGSV